jgi:hypothetical protein
MILQNHQGIQTERMALFRLFKCPTQSADFIDQQPVPFTFSKSYRKKQDAPGI